MYSYRQDEALVGTIADSKGLQVGNGEAWQHFLINLFLHNNSGDSAVALAHITS